jgi:rod shape-determining protein MreD
VSEVLNPRSRSDRYGLRINRTHSATLAYALPWTSVMLGSILPQLPIASAIAMVPPFGFILLLSWRLVRPGLFPVWAGFPLGLFDDLFSGQPFGSAILLWSLTMLVIELLEMRFPWRGFLQDWLLAAFATAGYILAAAFVSGGSLTPHMLAGLVPQMLIAVLVFPIVARIVAGLDRLRLVRFWRTG